MRCPNPEGMMRYVAVLILYVVCCQSLLAQNGKISYPISNGLQIAGVDGTNPVIYDNDMLNIPRFFSPNNDGVNDVWGWPNPDLYENSPLIIFNRFGQRIFETASYQNNWNGTLDGKPLRDDAYYYSIKLSNTDVRGAVRIVR
jgi:gliding motility-associated-like protein